MKTTTFLSAEWRQLLMANYVVDEEVVLPYLPIGTVLDLYEDRCYMSLVGFLFQNTRLRGFRVPFHVEFEEVNLRFYVRRAIAAASCLSERLCLGGRYNL
jgi:uncharacterized protein YqjF (DUF2071 family)